MYELYIANKNYSSWSLRPWSLMRECGIPFTERLLPFGDPSWRDYKRISPNGRVPCLVDGKTVVWDSLAIVEYLAERHAGVWPQDPVARAFARSAAAEMHSGFAELRNRCSMSCGVRMRLKETPAALERDLERIDGLWSDGLARFSGPYLAGSTFTAADAFYAPVAFRVQTYGLALGSPRARAYAERLLALPTLQAWYADALAETFRDEPHELEIAAFATVFEDLRRR
jgi:glutathione S-transferase